MQHLVLLLLVVGAVALIGLWINSRAVLREAKAMREILEVNQGYLKQIAAHGRSASAKADEKPASEG